MAEEINIPEMARRLPEAAPKGSEVILFGSRARGDARPDSDVDFLVLEPTVTAVHQEMTRLRRVLKGSPIPVDILVETPETYREWCETPGNVYYHIAQEGRILAKVG